MNIKVKLSTLWVFVMLNWLYCDVMTLMDSVQLKQILSGSTGSIQLTQGFLLVAAVLMEIPMAMVVLSRVLNYKSNRWTNILAGTVMALVQISSLFVGTGPTIYYLFFSIIEISCVLFIVWCSWKWQAPEASPNNEI